MGSVETAGVSSDPTTDLILSADAMTFVAELEHRFGDRRRRLLEDRAARQIRIDDGEIPRFRSETAAIRDAEWLVAPPRPDLSDRRVEITGPVERKMMINALNSGARVFMADFEDSASPTWRNMIDGQLNLRDAVRDTISFTNDAGKEYRLGEETATLMVRPRGWHLTEKHLLIDGQPMSASLFDFGLFFFHNAHELIARGSGPYFYLPKLESQHEARLWNDVFVHAQEALGIPLGTIRATVLIETVLAAFEMDEILYELRDHSAGLNAGRWDYIFSIIKKFRNHPSMVLPDRSQVTMTVPFMSAYTDLLIKTCHRRGAHALGGMSAYIPSRRDDQVNAIARANVTADKERESHNGHDGTWVAHPDLVAVAETAFAAVLGEAPHQIERQRDDVALDAAALLDVKVEGGSVTLDGVRTNVDVGIRYLASWLSGNGAAAIYNLMEDAATAEISRSQLWQWVHTDTATDTGEAVTSDLVRRIADEEMTRLHAEVGEEVFAAGRFAEARELLERVALGDEFPEFLTLPGYELID